MPLKLPGPRVACCARTLVPLSGDAASSFWRDIAPIRLRDTVSGAEPAQATTVRLAWDATELRVLFVADDTEAWATLTQRDDPLYEEEVVELFLDPVGDLESYFEIEVNPLNTVLDLVVRKNRSGYVKNFAWRCDGLRTCVKKTAKAWTAELSIPFPGLIADPPVAGDRWRANFFRIDRPKGAGRELSAWSPTGHQQFHLPDRFGVLEFARSESRGKE